MISPNARRVAATVGIDAPFLGHVGRLSRYNPSVRSGWARTPEEHMSRIVLAGYNLDADVIAELVRACPESPDLTPETLSAAYARISRDARPVDALRRLAREDVARARQSNQRIVFGLGHHSVAEHAVFNFDVIDVSRLAIESLEAHRLASYTEKSQRYVRLGRDFLVPDEWAAAGLGDAYRDYVLGAFDRYQRILDALVAAGIDAKLAGEDARYVLPLGVLGQLGMTLNARSLEHVILRLSGSPLAEVRDLGTRLLELARPIAPSLLRYMDPGPYDLMRGADIAAAVRDVFGGAPCRQPVADADDIPCVRLIDATPDGDARILAALALPALEGDLTEALARVQRLGEGARRRLFEGATDRMGIHDALPREFEHGVMTFELVMSAAAFGQFKRHRMASLTWLPYDPSLGLTIPPAIAQAGLSDLLHQMDSEARTLVGRLGADHPAAAYAWTNAHRRRTVLTTNLREFYHISRLREDEHAQWDIRYLVGAMSGEARRAFPVCASLLGGKDLVATRLAEGRG